jgi:myo-inositol-1(or 4)-monophosphatase
MEHLRGALEVGNKSTGVDMVTEIDQRCEDLITSGIRKAFPSHALLGEEEGRVSGESDYLWVIDPLDGTTNYVHGLPIFASSIALLYRGEPVVGVVHAAPLRVTYTAVRGEGAYRNDASISVAAHEELDECIIGTGVPYDRAESPVNNVDYMARITPQVRGLRRLGAAAYDLCLVADGIYDAYWELKVSLWDIAAGALIAEEAGAVVRYGERAGKYNVIAASPGIYPVLCRELNSVGDQFAELCDPSDDT